MKPALKIAIVGRPNVGKSSLMNALLGFRRSIVLDMPGTTRDEISGTKDLGFGELEFTDTYGVEERTDASELLPRLQKSDLVLFVVDASVGCTPSDEEIGLVVRESRKPILLVANKMDRPASEGAVSFGKLAIEESADVSVAHRRGLETITEWIAAHKVEEAPFDPDAVVEDDPNKVLKIALVGKPNTGKSTLTNRLVGRAVSRVSPIPHTTRDTVTADVQTPGGPVRFLDTAGIRRARSIEEDVEVFSIQASRRAIRDADVVLLCIAIHEPVSDQDVRLVQLVADAGKPALVLLNFSDKLNSRERNHFFADSEFGRLLKGMPTLFVSGATGFEVGKILPAAWKLYRSAIKRIPTAKLNSIVDEIVARNPPPSRGLKNFNILYASQVSATPPTFVFFMNRKENLLDSYQRYLTSELKKRLGLKGQPVRLKFKARPRSDQRAMRIAAKAAKAREWRRDR